MSDGSHNETPADWVVTTANHWVYAGTGLANGSIIPSWIYYEWDTFIGDTFTPAGITVLASAVVPNNIRPGSHHEAAVYERGSAVVFSAGTIHFNQRLRADSGVAQIARNMLTRAGATPYQP
jgi:hypothetical protein